MQKYRIKYFFDYECSCLWSADDATKKRFDYPISPESLPLSKDSLKKIEEACRFFDTRLDWNDPGGPSPWKKEDCEKFNKISKELFELIKNELGEKFEIINEQSEIKEE